ncbi:MAG: cysteine desulfurase [Candidatus Aenigmarchaeota archaeon]|nr:cysteine desulfurase [Candidatus Aenigmarchaeota archaeon]
MLEKLKLKTFDAEEIRKDFPILERRVNGKQLVYLDSAATSQKPRQVIEAEKAYYSEYNANIHRGVHKLSQEATEAYEGVREKVLRLINAREKEEIIYTRGTTEAINIVTGSVLLNSLQKGDEIVLTVMEHHSNLVPWLAMKKRGIDVKFVDINDDGTLKMEQFEVLITKKTRIVAVSCASNLLGTINDARKIAKIAHENDALALLDAAQAVPHMPVDVKAMDCDFLAFSGHKMLGPTGTGILYGKRYLLEEMEPVQFGGDMIKEVHLTHATWNDLPWKFEAGTPNIAGVIGLGVAIDYLQKIGLSNIRMHEKQLIAYALKTLKEIKGIRIFGPMDPEIRGGVISFNLADVHPHDLATVLDYEGIAVRSGHHCAMPLTERLGETATTRASFYIYNTEEEIDRLVEALEKARKVFGV